MADIENLLEVMAALRDPESGCPWDLAQDFASIAPYTLEEAYEVADAIARNDLDDLKDELGDLLLQVVFHARMAEETGAFDFGDVVTGIVDKLTRRHPHVFGTAEERRRGAEAGSWERIKAEERRQRGGEKDGAALDGVPEALPALVRADKLGRRASGVGFDWPDARGARRKVAEELGEFDAAVLDGRPSGIHDELGDLLFAVVNVARHHAVDPEQALMAANRKFERRFRAVEAAARADGVALDALDAEALDAYWRAAKATLAEES